MFDGVMGTCDAEIMDTLYTIVKSLPPRTGCTAMLRSTFCRVADCGLMLKGRKTIWPFETVESPMEQTSVFPASVARELSCAYSGIALALSQLRLKANSVPLNVSDVTVA